MNYMELPSKEIIKILQRTQTALRDTYYPSPGTQRVVFIPTPDFQPCQRLGTSSVASEEREGTQPSRHSSSYVWYLQLILKADLGILVPATTTEQSVGIGVRRTRGPVVTFLPFGGWGCKDKNRIISEVIAV